MKRSWLLAQVTLVVLLAVPLYLAILPSLVSGYGWDRPTSIAAFFAFVPLALVAVVAYHWYARRRLLAGEAFSLEDIEVRD